MKRAALLLLLVAKVAAASPVTVKVIEIAGGVAYVDQGSVSGLVRGTKITFGTTTFVVVEVTDKTASIELGNATLAIGASGIADVTPRSATVETLPKPRPPEAFREQWPPSTPPALAQTPKHVPLGSGKRRGATSVTLVGHGYAVRDRNNTDAAAEARLIASFQMTSQPLGVDLDVAGRAFRHGANKNERVPFFVRAAQVRYGVDADDPQFAIGRLRYAASSLGMLDGARAAMHVSSFELAAFGGIVPDPINGKPETSAARFGAEATYRDDNHRASLTAYGSTFEGKLDERRLVASGSASNGPLWIDAFAEAQTFPSDNPWGASAFEIVGAGTTAQWRKRGTHIGGDITYLRPERSLRLAAALPPAWLCSSEPQPGDVVETCDGGDSWTSGAVFAGTTRGRWSVDAIGSIGRTHGRETHYDSSGYIGGEVRFGQRRILASVSAGSASFVRWSAAEVGVGAVLTKKLDATLQYRPELLDYVAATEPFLLHTGILDMHYAARPDVDLALAAMGTTGTDRDAIAVLTTIVWRPL